MLMQQVEEEAHQDGRMAVWEQEAQDQKDVFVAPAEPEFTKGELAAKDVDRVHPPCPHNPRILLFLGRLGPQGPAWGPRAALIWRPKSSYFIRSGVPWPPWPPQGPPRGPPGAHGALGPHGALWALGPLAREARFPAPVGPSEAAIAADPLSGLDASFTCREA